MTNSNSSWSIGLKSFKAGDPSTTGIQKIWDGMLPPANLNLLAQVAGALWADTFWTNTKMDSGKLAMQINSAIGINLPDAQAAAANAFSQWSGLLVRSNMSDVGTIPRPGTLTASPDVVLNGQNQLTPTQIIQQWNQTVWSPDPGLKNYVYGRAQSYNIGVDINNATLRGYYSDAGFNPPPASWIQMFTWKDQSETSPLTTMKGGSTIGEGSRAANGDADGFAFTPPGAGHYCLIIVANTEFFANNPSRASGNWSSQEWIMYNGAAGWHNVNVTSSGTTDLKYYNEDGTAETFVFEAHCHNLPSGTRVALQADDAALRTAISGAVVTHRDYHLVAAKGVVPANYTGELKVTIEIPGGGVLPPGASVEVRQLWQVGPGHQHYVQAVRQLNALDAYALGEHVLLKMGDYTFIGAGYGQAVPTTP